MPEIYHIKIKKEYAAALIDDLIKIDAVEDLGTEYPELAQWQKEALEKESQAIAANPDYLIPWDDVKNRFKQP
ncbi:MAG TPA: addiction module protein [Hanamia sp.]|jgi:Putative addiction module component.